MNLTEAINASQIWAARGYDEQGECVVSIAYYGDELCWLKGFGGNWAKTWEPLSDEDREDISHLDFRPTGPKPPEQIEQEVVAALKEISEDDDDFEPMGETHD